MSVHNGPRINAEREILNKKNLTREEKEKQLSSINKAFDKLYKKLNKKRSRGLTVRPQDFQSCNCEFKSRRDHHLLSQ